MTTLQTFGLVAGLIGLAVLITAIRRGNVVRVSNIAQGKTNTGHMSYLATAAISGRYRFGKKGADAQHIAVCAANTDKPRGIITDEASAAELPVNVHLCGQGGGTEFLLLGGTVADGDDLVPDAAGAGIKLPTASGTYYPAARALQAGVSGDVIHVMTYAAQANGVVVP